MCIPCKLFGLSPLTTAAIFVFALICSYENDTTPFTPEFESGNNIHKACLDILKLSAIELIDSDLIKRKPLIIPNAFIINKYNYQFIW